MLRVLCVLFAKLLQIQIQLRYRYSGDMLELFAYDNVCPFWLSIKYEIVGSGCGCVCGCICICQCICICIYASYKVRDLAVRLF